jgi:uncharacterized protein with PIN domain
MATARFTFLPDLNGFLIPEHREGTFDYPFEPGQSIKHLVEAAGVPHTEVGQMLVNGAPVDFSYPVRDGDRVEVSPTAEPYPGEPRFVLDGHLGRLAAYLRMLGFDVTYRNDFDDEELARIAEEEERILVTRDRRLLMRRGVRYGYCPRSLDPSQQLVEAARRYGLAGRIAPFRRCLRCNTLLEPVSKEAVLDQLEPLTKRYYDEFHRCPACGQVYWKGSHYEHMLDLIEQIRGLPGNQNGREA